jgi:hypothetical protein
MAREATIVLDEILLMISNIEKTAKARTRPDIEADYMVFLGIQRAIEPPPSVFPAC